MKVLPRILWILIAVALLTGLFVVVAYAMPAEQDQAKPQPPVAVLNILAVPGNIKNANAITGTVKYMTDTAVGPKTATVALLSSGLPNVPISVPVHLSVTAAEPASKVMTATWTLTAPDGSKAKIKDSKSLTLTEFMPDLAGAYKVDVVLATRRGQWWLRQRRSQGPVYPADLQGHRRSRQGRRKQLRRHARSRQGHGQHPVRRLPWPGRPARDHRRQDGDQHG